MARYIETETLEYKREISRPVSLAKEVVALANTRGGRIGIGVDTKLDEVVGIDFTQALEERIANIIHDQCKPLVQFSIGFETLQGKTVLFIDIPEGLAKPYHLKSSGIADAPHFLRYPVCTAM